MEDVFPIKTSCVELVVFVGLWRLRLLIELVRKSYAALLHSLILALLRHVAIGLHFVPNFKKVF